MSPIQTTRKTNYRWYVCGMLFMATMINYMDRQVLSLTWKDFISPEFAWNDNDYGKITATFALVYAVGMLVSGRFVGIVGTRRGYFWAMCIWSFGAILHGFCGVLTAGFLTNQWVSDFADAKELLHDASVIGLAITTMSIYIVMACRIILALGESANFPAAISATVEFFPKKDRGFAISVFNNGASVGALFAPLIIPTLARHFGWEMAFVVVGSFGYLWVLLWIFTYMKPQNNDYVNISELQYIHQDEEDIDQAILEEKNPKRLGILKCLSYKQTWGLIFGKLLTDGAWWFYLFWTPVYISEIYGYTSDSPMGMAMIFVIYLISILSIGGGYLPTHLVNRYGGNPYACRMQAMLLFAALQLIGIFVLPLGSLSPWLMVIAIGICAAAHQSWSANLFAMVGDFFPKHSVATVTGIAGFAGGLASYAVTITSGALISSAEQQGSEFSVLFYSGKEAAYMLVFCTFSFMYLIGWGIMRMLMPSIVNIEKKQ